MSENSFYYNLYSPYYVFTTHLEAVYRHGGSSAFLLAVSSAVIVSLIWTVLHVKRHSYCNCLHRCNKWKVVCNYGSVVALSHVWPMPACLKGLAVISVQTDTVTRPPAHPDSNLLLLKLLSEKPLKQNGDGEERGYRL